MFDEDLRNGERIATMMARRFEHNDSAHSEQVFDSEPASPPAKQSGVGA